MSRSTCRRLQRAIQGRIGLVSVTALLCLAASLAVVAQPAEQQSPAGQPAPGDSAPTPTDAAPTPRSQPVAGQTQLREVTVNSKRPKKSTAAPRKPAAGVPQQAAPTTAATDTGSANLPGLQQTPQLGKTGTKLEDLPVRVQIISRETFTEQADIVLRQTLTNASGVNEGGQDSLGYFDHFLIRGLNAQIYSDGFSDGDQLGGVSHSLNGVQRIEILEGPGSALFGSGPPGGTINLVHFLPSPVFQYGGSLLFGSFGTVTNNNYVTGPTTIPGLNYRVDTTLTRTDGFRNLAGRDYEIRPDFTWNVNNHLFEASLDARHIEQTPDSYGLIYFNGSPITNASIDSKYSTPFAFANQNYIRPTISDKWFVGDFLTVNNRFSYTNRQIDAERNGDSTRTTVCLNPATQKDPVTGLPCVLDQVVGRQLRQQSDTDNTFDYQLEPIWKFATGPIGHTLLTGFEAVRQTMDTERTTADLPNITNVFAPVPPETSTAGLIFKCDATHSCDNDNLAATYLSLYATDQMDVGDKLKVRAGVRQDWWDTTLNPLTTVPGRFTSTGVPIIAGMPLVRDDAPVSWNVGALYKLFPGVSPYFGISKSYLTNFNSENTQNGIGAPESALQYEAGLKLSFFNDKFVLTGAVFDVARDNVAAAVTINGVETVVYDSQRTKGVEANLDAAITEQWHILANATAMNAVITDNPQAVTSIGNHPQGVPAYMANLWTTYKFSIAGVPGFQVGAGVNYRDTTYSDITNVNVVPAYVIANAAFSYETPIWGVALNVKNITNQRYFIAANAAGGFVGDPLGAFITLHVKR